VYKAAKDATLSDKGKPDFDFRTEVIETNNNARSDHGGGEAAHRQLLKEQTNKAISLKGIPWKQFMYSCPPFVTSPLSCPSKSPVFRLSASPQPPTNSVQSTPVLIDFSSSFLRGSKRKTPIPHYFD